MKFETIPNSFIKYCEDIGPHKIHHITHHYFSNILKVEKIKEIDEACMAVQDDNWKNGNTVYDGDAKHIIDYRTRALTDEQVPYSQEIAKIVEDSNKRIFNLDIDCAMKFQYIVYDENSHFDWHPDGPFSFYSEPGFSPAEDAKYRKLTLIIMLTPHTEYEGGEFILNDPQLSMKQCIRSFKMDIGEAILFPSFLFHKVAPLKSGQRRTLVAWFCGPRWR